MNCPNCGSQTLADQQFCRSCGESLMADEPRRPIPRAFWGMTLAFAGILLALIGSMIDIRAVVMIGVIMSVLGMFSIAAMSILNQGRKRSPRVSKQPGFLSEADSTNKLPPMNASEHFPSVTENTTNLLKEPANHNELNRRS